MSNEENLRAGITAARSGDLERAAGLLAEVVSTDPSSEQGWLWLAACLIDTDRQIYCLRRVLVLNPNNRDARDELTSLTGIVSAPPVSEQRSAVSYQQSAGSSKLAAESSDESEVEGRKSGVVRRESDDSRPKVQALSLLPISDSQSPVVPRRKKPNKIFIALLLIILVLAICGLGAAYMFMSGRMSELLSPGLPPLPTALVLPTALQTSEVSETPTQNAQALPPPTALASPRPTVAYTARYDQSTCNFDAPHGVNVSCGYLIVPEDRTGDPSHTIRLAVAVYHSTSANPAAEAVVFLQGGPGGEAVQLSAQAYDLLVSPFLDKRDFIAFDQRGTGLSEPALKCDELSKDYLQDLNGLIPGSARKLVYANAFLACQGLMSAQGIDSKAYTTEASAADVKDLLNALGYQKADLYGASYGTRLALVIMRDHPEIVHSVILDSVVPVESNFYAAYPHAIESALKTLFDSCAAEPKCNDAYPQLESIFWQVVSQLDAKPVTLTTSGNGTGAITVNVDGSTFTGLVLGSLKQSNLIDTAPQTIYRFKGGDYSSMIASQSSMPFAFEGISPGLYISMMCHEHVLATTPEELQAAATAKQNIREYAWLPFYGDAQDLLRLCTSWGATGPVAGENDAVSSDIPTLIITGKYDPTTPPMYAQQVASHLSHSYYFEFPNQGHTPTAADSSGCAMQTAVDFLNNPTVEPDRSCLNKMTDVQFLVPYTATPPLKLKKVDAAGISTMAPADWMSLGDGFYSRGQSPFDITQAGVFQVDGTSSAELVNWLSMKAYGYRGLDSAPAQAGQRQANGLRWTLYTSTSYGRPVDIAMADYRGRSVVVLSFSDNDEHDAMYRTVFLPMVDGTVP